MAGPFFMTDFHVREVAPANFGAMVSMPNHVGCIIKATEGVHHAPTLFQVSWPRARAVGGDRYGRSWFRGAYHFASPTPSGTEQADYMLKAVEKAGGWGEGDLPPAWDLEGDKWTSRQEVVDRSSEFSERIKQRLGREPIIYTGSTWRKLVGRGTERAGFNTLWTTHMDLMAPYGWPNSSVVIYQYVGDGKYWNPRSKPALANYPTGVPGLGSEVDMNVVMDRGEPAASIDRVREILVGRAARERGGVSLPVAIGVGAGIFALGILAATAGRDELT